MALGTTACDNLKSEPVPPPPPGKEEPPPELRVTVRTEGPEYCREGQWTLSVSVEGGTPERVELLTNAQEPMTLEAPYQHVIDCATHAEGRFSFVARAVGEERNFEAESASVVVDRTPPTIASRRPLLSHPSVTSPLAFVFSEPLLPGSLQSVPTQLRDQDGFSVAHQAVLSEDGTVLELVPTSPIRPPTTLHAVLLQRTLTDRAGNLLDPRLVAFALTHNATYWPFARVTEPLDPTNSSVLPMSLALGRGVGGTMPVVGFTDSASETEEPAVARWDGHAWQHLPPLRAEDARSRPALGLQVAADGESLIATWREEVEETGFDQIHVVSYDGTAWKHLGAPHDTQSEYTQVKLTLGWLGRPVIALEQMLELGDTEVRVIEWNGTEWLALGEPLSANPAPRTSSWRAAIAADSEVFVSWLETSADTGALHLHVSMFENGRWFPVGSSIPIPADTSVDRVEIAIQPYDRVALAWSELNPTTYVSTIRFSSAKLRSGPPVWSTPESIEVLSQTSTHASLRLVVDRDNEPWLAWTEYPFPQDNKTYYRRRRAGAWQPKQLISGETLSTFLLDANAFPWVLSGFTVVRPQ
ncbi:Ig-like domain-containing protein [Myxococcus xanthus]|uniref:Ig-like domain-containing protein n=1 Tax=Myxococcus xanthus TaxID=34 RepID=UPI001F1D1619|nr:Ig-like domain-containing protein [Myxococcus xanthus]